MRHFEVNFAATRMKNYTSHFITTTKQNFGQAPVVTTGVLYQSYRAP